MPPANTLGYHVSGPVAPQFGIGSAGAFVTVGVCYDGATIDIPLAQHGIFSDGGGGPQGKPVEWIALNAVATIRFKLIPYAGNYINKLRALAVGSATEGVLPIPGTLMGGNGFLPPLYLPSADGDGPWTFSNVRVVKPGSNQVSTKETGPDWELEGLVYFDPSVYISVGGRTLYTRAAP